MLCTEFEDRLTDYLDGALGGDEQRACGEHALRCPVCHELLNEVRNAIVECRACEHRGVLARTVMAERTVTCSHCGSSRQPIMLAPPGK